MNGEPFCYGSRLTVRQLLELRVERLRPDPHPDRPPGAPDRGRRRGVHVYAADHRERYADFFEADGSLGRTRLFSRARRPGLPAQYRLPGVVIKARPSATGRELTPRHRTAAAPDRLPPVTCHRPVAAVLGLPARPSPSLVLACGAQGQPSAPASSQPDAPVDPTMDGRPVPRAEPAGGGRRDAIACARSSGCARTRPGSAPSRPNPAAVMDFGVPLLPFERDELTRPPDGDDG